jgi:hypothetical protein
VILYVPEYRSETPFKDINIEHKYMYVSVSILGWLFNDVLIIETTQRRRHGE